MAYLWRRDQKELLSEMASAGVGAILIKVAAMGLSARHLGKSIAEMYPYLCTMVRKIQNLRMERNLEQLLTEIVERTI